MTDLDESVVEEVCKMLNASQDFDQDIQNEIFRDMSSFQSQSDIALYLLSAVANGDLSDTSRCVSAILMRRFFAFTKNATKEIFKTNIYPVLAPFFDLSPSPLVNCVSSLFADMLKYFGIDTFPDIPQIIFNLLEKQTEQSQSGLSLIYELLLRDIDLDISILNLLSQHLTTEHSSFVSKILSLFAKKFPNEIFENILTTTVFQIEFNELQEEEILQTINICREILNSRIDEEI